MALPDLRGLLAALVDAEVELVVIGGLAVCSAVVTLRGGTLLAAGTLSHTSERSEWAITGGTGEDAGAGGSVVLEQLSATRTAATITLVP